MAEKSDEHDDWRPPSRRVYEEAWDAHPQREQLKEFAAERDEHGNPTWVQRTEHDGEHADWTAVWLRPVNPLDPRGPGIRIVRYPADLDRR